jgi:predicted outer membrane repeat protein
VNQGSFVNCSFVGNTADSTGNNPAAGALRLSNGSVTNCTFDGNKATSGSGGAVSLAGFPVGTIPFVDCTFINNVAAGGGAVFAPANTLATFAGCHFVASAVTTKGNNDIARISTTAPRGFAC